MINRIKQFVIGIFERPCNKDYEFVNKYLNNNEKTLFFKLPYYEQMHGIRVAKEVLSKINDENINNDVIIKASLLHDIGKLGSGLNIVTKSGMVLLDKLCRKTLIKHNSNKIVNAYYNHPEIALLYLEYETKEVKYLILNHHNYNIEDKNLNILQRADNRN